MPALELRTFAAAALLGPSGSLEGAGVTHKPLALLVLLAGAGDRGLSRDKLMAYLWPEASGERGRNALRQTLYSLRRDLQAPHLFLSSAGTLRLNPAIIHSDLAAFRQAAASQAWEAAAELYRGPFLDGFFLTDAPEFERWVETERQALEETLRQGLEVLAQMARRAGDPAATVTWWRRLSRHDPLNSRITVALMDALDQAGEPGVALEVARSHGELLRAELGTGVDTAVADAVNRVSDHLSHGHSPVGRPPEPRPPASRAEPNEPSAAPAPARTRAPSGRTRHVLAGAMLGLVLLVALAVSRPYQPTLPDGPLIPPDPIQTVAVLPFEDRSPSRETRSLGTPLTEELSRRLAGVAALRVVGPGTTRAYVDSSDRGGRLARNHQVNAVLAGTVRVYDSRLEITIRLTDAKTDRILWSREHTGSTADLSLVQSALVRGIATALRVPLTEDDDRRIEHVPTTNADAYELYLRSTALSYANRVENLAGITLLQQAVHRDSLFAFALATLARRFMFLAYLTDPAYGDSGMAVVRRALAIDPGLGTAHFALGDLQVFLGQHSAARLSYLRAIDLDPGQLPAMVDLSDVDATLGRYDEALYWALRAVRIDPANRGFRLHLTVALYHLGVDETTERWLLDSERRWPTYGRFPIGLARLDYVRGRSSPALQRLRAYLSRDPTDEEVIVALAAFAALAGASDAEQLLGERLASSPDARPWGPAKQSFRALLALTLHRKGDTAGARTTVDTALVAARALERSGAEESAFAAELASLHALRGDTVALDWLERAYAAGEKDYRLLSIDPFFERFRTHPRFERLLGRMKADVATMRARAMVVNDTVFRLP